MTSTRFRPWTARLARTCGDHVLRIAAVICLMCRREGSNTGLTNFAAQTMIHLSDVELLITDLHWRAPLSCESKTHALPTGPRKKVILSTSDAVKPARTRLKYISVSRQRIR
jgi:hypothetical protein